MKNQESIKRTIEQLTFHHVKRGFFLLNQISDQHGMRSHWLRELQKLDLTVTFKQGRSCAIGEGGYDYRANRPLLRFRMSYFLEQPNNNEMLFPEYKFLRNREDIGSCRGDLSTVVAALCAHECAHVFQFWIIKMREAMKLDPEAKLFGFNLKQTKDGHGDLWRHVYSILRTSWINKLPSYQYLPPNAHPKI